MKIQLVSDLHLEFPSCQFQLNNDADADVLILGGDITTINALKNSDYSLDFFENVCEKYPRVIYLMGNHEHYHSVFQETFDIFKDSFFHLRNLSILEKQFIIIDDIVFFGATLWTDCNNKDERTKRELAKGLNDYRLIKYLVEEKNQINHLLPTNTINEYYQTVNSLQDVCKTYHDKKVVVCTHHAPSKVSTHPRYLHDKYMNGGYSSSLEWMMDDHPNIVLWTHGHVHDSFDYKLGTTRIVCNPRGYENYHHDIENINFNDNLIIEI
jgi:Icc-related predicted phosphoesterase